MSDEMGAKKDDGRSGGGEEGLSRVGWRWREELGLMVDRGSGGLKKDGVMEGRGAVGVT